MYISSDFLVELYTPTLEERYTPVQEEIFIIALFFVLYLNLGTKTLFIAKIPTIFKFESSTKSFGFILKYSPPTTFPALFITIPISNFSDN